MIAIVGEDETSILYIFFEIGAFLCVELDELVACDISEGIMKDIGAVEGDDFFLQVDGNGGVFYERVEEVGRHPLVGVPVARAVA